jgi:hypothetical protein
VHLEREPLAPCDKRFRLGETTVAIFDDDRQAVSSFFEHDMNIANNNGVFAPIPDLEVNKGSVKF